MILSPGQPIPHGRPYRYHLNGPVHMMTARKRVGPLPTHRLAVRHSADHSSSDSSSEASSDFHSDASSDSSSRHPLSDHSSPDLPSTSAGPSRKRRFWLAADVEVDPRETSLRDDVIVRVSDEPHLEQDIDPEIQAEIDECIAYADALRDRGIDTRVVVEAIDQDETETSVRGPVEVRVERVTHPAMPEDIPKPAQEGAVEATYETLGDLVQRFHDHTQAIPVHSFTGFCGVQDESSGHRIVGVESRSENEGNGNGGNGGNRNGGNGENGNGHKNGNHGMNYGGFMPVARECTFQDFLKCKPHNFSETEGVVGLTRWFEKMETVFNISNCPPKYQVKYATCTLQDSALTWWNSHKRTIGVETAYAINWVKLMKLMTEVYCPRNEIQKMETELWNICLAKWSLMEEDRVEWLIGGLPETNIPRCDYCDIQPDSQTATVVQEQNNSGQNVAGFLRLGTSKEGDLWATFPFYNSEGCTMKGCILIEVWKLIVRTVQKDCPKLGIRNRGNQTRNKNGNRWKQMEVTKLRRKLMPIGGEEQTLIPNVVSGFFGHTFDIESKPVELGSFDFIIGMDWMAKYHALIICDEKVVRIPYGNEVLIIRGDSCNSGKSEDKSEERRLEDVSIVQRELSKESFQRFARNYDARQREVELRSSWRTYTTLGHRLGAVVFALKMWRHYLYGTKCIVFTDHNNLQHILDQKELNMRERRWLEVLSDYDCMIRYHPGKENVVADALSRKESSKPLRVRALVMGYLGLNLLKKIWGVNRKPEGRELHQ
ncbi:reverse transcriptase domain-containing protein [Tanacetum coccineum]